MAVIFTGALFFAEAGRVALSMGFFILAEIVYRSAQSFIGPTIFGLVATQAALYYLSNGQPQELADQSGHRMAILSIGLFFIVGLGLLYFVDENKATKAGQTAAFEEDMP